MLVKSFVLLSDYSYVGDIIGFPIDLPGPCKDLPGPCQDFPVPPRSPEDLQGPGGTSQDLAFGASSRPSTVGLCKGPRLTKKGPCTFGAFGAFGAFGVLGHPSTVGGVRLVRLVR